MIDSSIREQAYTYFLSEAPELIEIIEQELFSLSQDYNIAKVHNLMRATHTIKGGAANVELDVINKVAHLLEDVFKALYNPDVKIDRELQTLLFQAFECLQLPLTAEITGSTVDPDEILQRAASVFALLQSKLGDAFGAETDIPTSIELGFDIVQSIFETGVSQRLESIATEIQNCQEPLEIANFLRSQADVFIGLAESLNLPGFGEIAQTIILALDINPAQTLAIAEIALANLQQAREAIFAGDRLRGGEPSPALQKFTRVSDDFVESATNSVPQSFTVTTLRTEIEELYKFLLKAGSTNNQPLNPTSAKFYLKVIRCILGWFNHQLDVEKKNLCLALIIPDIKSVNLIIYVENWLTDFWKFIQEQEDSQSLCIYRQGIILNIVIAVANFFNSCETDLEQAELRITFIEIVQQEIIELTQEYKKLPPITSEEKNWLQKPKLQKLLEIKEIIIPTVQEINEHLLETIWGEEVDHIEELAVAEEAIVVEDKEDTDIQMIPHLSGEVNQPVEEKAEKYSAINSRQRSFVRVEVEALERLNYLTGELLIYQKRRALRDEQLKDITLQLFQQLIRHQATLNKLGEVPVQTHNTSLNYQQHFAAVFDSLEMNEYTEFNLKLHEALEETLQLQETIESLDLLLTQANQINEKKQRLVLSIIDNLVEARMSPLGNILNRFPQMINNLKNVYGKTVELKLYGTQVLIDKAIAEKLYDPLLHLVRNAFDHGIESPEVRRQHGKSEQALIEIRAYHQGSQTMIEVRDDGEGLNFDKIYSKAIQLGFLQPDQTTTQEKLLEFLFRPGFSTTDKVSEISGRGMGLDIVRSQLQALNGLITVQSLPQKGTTFTLKIPFSMTTDQLMIVQAGGAIYALLLDSIEKILLPSKEQIKEFEGRKVLHWNTGADERMVSLRKLADLIYYNGSFKSGASLQYQPNIPDTGEIINPVLLIRKNDEILGLEVDQIIGEQELVIRPLGQAMTPPKYIYGCSSLANGGLTLVIDGALLLESREMEAKIEVMALPIATSLNQKALPMSVSSQSSRSNNKDGSLILVVDDAISLRQTLSLTLQKYGYQVILAQNGAEALEQLQRHPEVEVVISDLEMPRMNGFELLSHVRQNPELANKPVVILTSRSAEKHRQLAEALGATAYLTKPYLEREFISTVGSLTNRNVDNLTQLVMSK